MKRKTVWIVAILVVAAGAVGIRWVQLGGQKASWWRVVRTETGGQPHYDPIQYRAVDNRPAITNPLFVAASEAPMAAGTKGMGVVVGNEAKFYPLHILSYHQIVNDSCGDKQIACTF